jgi:hypothetical protein
MGSCACTPLRWWCGVQDQSDWHLRSTGIDFPLGAQPIRREEWMKGGMNGVDRTIGYERGTVWQGSSRRGRHVPRCPRPLVLVRELGCGRPGGAHRGGPRTGREALVHHPAPPALRRTLRHAARPVAMQLLRARGAPAQRVRGAGPGAQRRRPDVPLHGLYGRRRWIRVIKRHGYIRDALCQALERIPGIQATREPMENPQDGGDQRRGATSGCTRTARCG